MRHDPYMHEGETGKAESAATDADRDRYIQVLALEYQAMRSELTMRLSARYQFVGFITGAAALIGAGIGYSTVGAKTWILAGLAILVIFAGILGFYRMGFHIIHLAGRLATLENRINAIAEPGAAALLTWASGRRPPALWETVSLGYPFARARPKPSQHRPVANSPE
jgi:hypothetical protein